jgi:hypothetical protein
VGTDAMVWVSRNKKPAGGRVVEVPGRAVRGGWAYLGVQMSKSCWVP